MKTCAVVVLLSVYSLGCTSDGSGADACERGTEGCACLSSGGCDKGLSCLSDLCVDTKAGADDDASNGDKSSDDDASDDDGSATDDDTPSDDDASDDDGSATDDDASDDDGSATDDDASDDDGSATDDDTPSDDDAPSQAMPEPDPAAPMQSELSDGSLGSSCGQCDDYLECDTSAPGGYCTSACYGPEDCPGGDCYTIGGGAACLRSCDSDEDCRPGYSCGGLSESPVCIPGEAMPLGCSNACVHYLTCQGTYTEEGLQACTEACDGAGFTTADVEEYLSLGCSQAVAAVNGESSGSSGGGSDCKGCVWDGSSCTYYSDEYGSASSGYSWAAISCDSACCQ